MTPPKEQPLPRLLPGRAGETDDEKRLREALNRIGGKLISTLDAAIQLRTAPSEAQRTRHMVRGQLLIAATLAMQAFAIATEQPE